ncbi:hypothetical protein BDW60DRAFT_124115 [Aspergillus nidulans var. acristatus]
MIYDSILYVYPCIFMVSTALIDQLITSMHNFPSLRPSPSSSTRSRQKKKPSSPDKTFLVPTPAYCRVLASLDLPSFPSSISTHGDRLPFHAMQSHYSIVRIKQISYLQCRKKIRTRS